MISINDWLHDKNRDYDTGVKLYADSPAVKTRILTSLRKGKNERNLTTLIKELRQFRNTSDRPAPPVKPKPAKELVKPPKPVSIQTELEREQLIDKSGEKYFKKVRFGDLPAELRPRFKMLKDLWYEMSELKFVLNDIPDEHEEKALKVMLRIEALDETKDLIWKEIEHWQKYKTILPVKSGEDFSKMTPQQLYLKKANLGSYVRKKNSRIEKWKEELEKESRKPERVKIQQQISRTLKDVHQHELDIKTIDGIL